MKSVLLLEKQVGETPLQCIERFRAAYPEYSQIKMTYAGRLDPMADGLLLVLTGDAVHEKDRFLGLDKVYTCTAILGVSTDTYDILGMKESLDSQDSFIDIKKIEEVLRSYVGTFTQKYPPFSSKTVGGVALHQLAREGGLDDKELPTRQVTILGVDDIRIAEISRSEISADIIARINQVKGDFRQNSIINQWENWEPIKSVQVVSFTIRVSSGTYIRGIVDEMGKELGCGACIWKLHRSEIGYFSLKNKDF